MHKNTPTLVFNPIKSFANISKHGVPLTIAEDLDWETTLVLEDTRRNYGETRRIGIGYIGLRLYVVVYVDRDGERRIISLRKANAREAKRYAET